MVLVPAVWILPPFAMASSEDGAPAKFMAEQGFWAENSLANGLALPAIIAHIESFSRQWGSHVILGCLPPGGDDR